MTEEQMPDDVPAADAPEADVATPEPAPAPAPAKDWDDETESEARALGWKPADEWKGEKPVGYIDSPREFVERLERIGPFRKVREENQRLKAEMEARLAAMERIHKDAARREIERVRAAQEKAVELGDVERWKALRAEEERLAAPPKDAPRQPAPLAEDVRAFQEWAGRNPGVVSDPVLMAAADAIFQQAGNLPIRERFAAVDAQMRTRFPQMFGQTAPAAPARPAVAKVDGGGMARTSKKTDFDRLPREALDAWRKFVQSGVYKDTPEGREEYLSIYKGVGGEFI